MKKTLLEIIIAKNFSEELAKRTIRSGKVKVNDEVIFIPSSKINSTDNISIIKSKEWVSRGALKLIKAIELFKIDFQNKIVLDIGSSTGGFSQVALKYGAKEINALDVGTNQLDYKIRSNPQVNVFEKTNLKTIVPSMFNNQIDIIVVDVSFISLKHVFNVSKNLGNNKLQIMALIKPQFEANSNQVLKGGIVAKEFHQEIIDKIKIYAKNNNFELKFINASPILGNKSKNIEYISLFEKRGLNE